MENKSAIKNQLFKNLTDTAIILGIATGLLFILGRAATGGYYEYWGLTAEYSGPTFHELLYTGYLFASIGLGKLIAILSFWVIGIYVFLRLLLWLTYKFKDKIKPWVAKFDHEEKNDYHHVIAKTEFGFMLIWAIFMLIFGLLLLHVQSSSFGKEIATNAHKSYLTFENPKYFVKNARRFYSLACNDTSCAVFFPIQDEVEIVARDWLIGARKHIEPPVPKEKEKPLGPESSSG